MEHIIPLERRQLLSAAFGQPTNIPTDSSAAITKTMLADVNGDGAPDLITTYVQAIGDTSDTSIGVRLGNGNGTFAPAQSFSIGQQTPFDLIVADVNGDGRPDLVAAISNEIEVFEGNGNGTFQAPIISTAGDERPYTILAADINGDGKLDIIAAGKLAEQNGDSFELYSSLFSMLGNGDGTFAAPQTIMSQPGGFDAFAPRPTFALGDFNDDGRTDIVYSDEGSPLDFFYGNGNGTFSSATSLAIPDSSVLAGVADMNGDGNADLILLGRSKPEVAVLLGNGNGTFQSPITTAVNQDLRNAAIVDLNGDGIPDLVADSSIYEVAQVVISVPYASQTQTVLLGTGNGGFQTPQYLSNSPGSYLAGVADLTGDGKPDLLLRSDSQFAVIPNITPGSVPFAQLTNGQLIVTGTTGNDTIGLSVSNGLLTASLNGGTSAPFQLSDVQSVEVIGLDGNDSINIGTGVPATVALGGAGNDTIVAANSANNTLNGGAGADSISAAGASGNNVLHDNTGPDTLVGGSGNDSLMGDRGLDLLTAGAGNVLLSGGPGQDTLYGGTGANLILGGLGNDLIQPDSTFTTILGGGGNDTVLPEPT